MKKIRNAFFLLIALIAVARLNAQTIIVGWAGGKPKGSIEVLNGKIEHIKIVTGKGKTDGLNFEIFSDGEVRMEIIFSEANISTGSYATIVTIKTHKNPFSFFLRDVNKKHPIFISEYGVLVTEQSDIRSYPQIVDDIRSSGLLNKLEMIEQEPEESYEKASVSNRNQTAPTWLGIARDMRIFEISGTIDNVWREAECITPRNASSGVKLKEFNNTGVSFAYAIGRGAGVEQKGSRRLENGILPVLHTTLHDEDITYHTTSFVTLEFSELNNKTNYGTHFMVADYYSYGNMFTKEQNDLLKPLLKADSSRTEETVLYCRAEAVNNGKVPRYAYFKTIRPGYFWWDKSIRYHYDKKTGMSVYSSGNVFAISKINGKPMEGEEMSILLQPGEKATMEFFLPHAPVSMQRATRIAQQSFDSRLNENIAFWNYKINQAADMHVPESRLNEMMRAGLLHLDLITYGQEPHGTLAPMIGVYSPIGTESSPIIQYYCSMGLKDEARRSLQYFLDKQHDNGMMQNFGGYMVETGAALYTIGEYHRYFHDDEWIKQIKPKLLKSCEYLIKWREKNKDEKLRGKGYGMIDGKVADPEDQYHQYMLNAYAYIGISRTAEMLSIIDPKQSKRLKTEVQLWKKDIRESLERSIAHSPVIPMGNGEWVPTVPPWTEATTLQMLFADSAHCFSHGSFAVRDALIGPLYLVFCEVLEPQDPLSKMMLNYHSELMFTKNVSFSQPYYTRNDWLQLKLGMVKPFLKTFYNTFPAISDRETYTFYEHLHQVSVHKTHEEAWFLMQTRWMLYMEDGAALKLLPGVPSAWIEDGKTIEVNNAYCYFGKLSFKISSQNGIVEATIDCPDRKPSEIILRLPHPQGKKPVKVTGGVYNAADETILIKPFNGKAVVKAVY